MEHALAHAKKAFPYCSLVFKQGNSKKFVDIRDTLLFGSLCVIEFFKMPKKRLSGPVQVSTKCSLRYLKNLWRWYYSWPAVERREVGSFGTDLQPFEDQWRANPIVRCQE